MNDAAQERTGYLAAEGFEAELREDLRHAGVSIELEQGRLLVAAGSPVAAPWAQNVWPDLRALPCPSVGAGAKALRALGRNWASFQVGHHRRAALIEAQLPHVSARPLVFPAGAPTAPLGAWTLRNPREILASARATSPFPNGAARFVEDRTGPPNRAYLKLWELLALKRQWPQAGERCLDLGASPGGWTWVLAQLGAQVLAVDKAPLDPGVAALPGVTQRLDSAFALDPAAIMAESGPVDWLFSDVICYPERLLALVRRWLDAGAARRIACSVKFQGETDHATARMLAAIPGAWLQHLSHNKHELTWTWGW
ncbi:MAG: hypothetical protein JNK11_17005 [Alphaproteobacteria bacterium]|nr:hypothetical protein [Alphaproteobacteria bacterium]